MSIWTILFVMVFLGYLAIVWHRSSPKQRLAVILFAMVAFVLFACGGDGGEDWNLDVSKDVTGTVWRSLPGK